MSTTIRPLTRDEIESDAFWPLLWEAAGVDADALMWIRDVELPKLHAIGAVDGDVVGFAAYEKLPDRLELHYLSVSEDARGAGLGTRLIDALCRTAPSSPLVAETDDDAVGFYRALDFTVTDAPRDARWPDRRRYRCERSPRADSMDITLNSYRNRALRYVEGTPSEPSPLVAVLQEHTPPGAHVLELGSGPGRDAGALEAAGYTVDRTDAAAPFVALQHAAGHRARLLDVRAGDFGGPFDAVFASAVLLHIDRTALPDVLATARRATRPGGVIVASFKKGDGEAWTDAKLDAPRHFVFWREEALGAQFRAAGWREVVARDATKPGAPDEWIFVTATNPHAP